MFADSSVTKQVTVGCLFSRRYSFDRPDLQWYLIPRLSWIQLYKIHLELRSYGSVTIVAICYIPPTHRHADSLKASLAVAKVIDFL